MTSKLKIVETREREASLSDAHGSRGSLDIMCNMRERAAVSGAHES